MANKGDEHGFLTRMRDPLIGFLAAVAVYATPSGVASSSITPRISFRIAGSGTPPSFPRSSPLVLPTPVCFPLLLLPGLSDPTLLCDQNRRVVLLAARCFTSKSLELLSC